MAGRERELIEWLSSRWRETGSVLLGIGDDMAVVRHEGDSICFSTDMLLDGVHFDRRKHEPEMIGRKSVGCVLSDCAAMAAVPVAIAVSTALPADWTVDDSKRLFIGMDESAREFGCEIVGGDTTCWEQRLAIDVALIARSPDPPVRRSGARVGDTLLVTGTLGGSGLGSHLTFTPRIREARSMAEHLGPSLHAMIDLSDGLSLDLHRMCEASGVGAELDETLLVQVISPDAVAAAGRDGRTPLEHALEDGEDFELLAAVTADACHDRIEGVASYPVGRIVESGVSIRRADGRAEPLVARGFEHQ